jgi:hypothetical protein
MDSFHFRITRLRKGKGLRGGIHGAPTPEKRYDMTTYVNTCGAYEIREPVSGGDMLRYATI